METEIGSVREVGERGPNVSTEASEGEVGKKLTRFAADSCECTAAVQFISSVNRSVANCGREM